MCDAAPWECDLKQPRPKYERLLLKQLSSLMRPREGLANVSEG